MHKKPSALRVWIFPVLLEQRNRKPGTGTQLNFKQQEIKITALKKPPKAANQTCFQFHALALKYKIWCFVQLIPAIIRNLYPAKRGTCGSLMSCIDRPTSMDPTEILCPAAVAPLTSQGLFLLHVLKPWSPESSWKLMLHLQTVLYTSKPKSFLVQILPQKSGVLMGIFKSAIAPKLLYFVIIIAIKKERKMALPLWLPSALRCSSRPEGWGTSVWNPALNAALRELLELPLKPHLLAGQVGSPKRSKGGCPTPRPGAWVPSSWTAAARAGTHFFKCAQHFTARKRVVPHRRLKHYRAAALPRGNVFMVCWVLLHRGFGGKLGNVFAFWYCF